MRPLASNVINLLVAIAVICVEPSFATPVPAEVKKLVAFIYIKNDKGELLPNGTGFFIGVPSKLHPETQSIYLVTARHVLQPSGKPMYPKIWVRINRATEDAVMVEMDLAGPTKQNVLLHDDQYVDIAAISWAPDAKLFDYQRLGLEHLVSPHEIEKLGIREGSDVFFAGLFTSYIGQKRIHPIIRFGRVAMLPEEKVAWGKRPDGSDDLRTLYLLESQSYGGNSGAPVFFYLGADRQPGVLSLGPPVLKLAGVMMGSFLDIKPIEIVEQSVRTAISKSNVGIAAVVPSHLLHELLMSKAGEKQREESEKQKGPP